MTESEWIATLGLAGPAAGFVLFAAFVLLNRPQWGFAAYGVIAAGPLLLIVIAEQVGYSHWLGSESRLVSLGLAFALHTLSLAASFVLALIFWGAVTLIRRRLAARLS